jgi:4-hydroxy-tetrahydrodipicolinate synthase
MRHGGGNVRVGLAGAGHVGGGGVVHERRDPTEGLDRRCDGAAHVVLDRAVGSDEANDHWYDSWLDELVTSLHRSFGASNVESTYSHWGSAFKAAAAELGLPVGDYARSRPP